MKGSCSKRNKNFKYINEKSENHNDSGKPIFRIKKRFFVDKNFTSCI